MQKSNPGEIFLVLNITFSLIEYIEEGDIDEKQRTYKFSLSHNE